MPYQAGHTQGGYYADRAAYGQQQSSQANEVQYGQSPIVVIPPRHVVQQAPPYHSTSPHQYQPRPGHLQQPPVQYSQSYQPPYQSVQSPQSLAQVIQQTPYQHQQQYYAPQPVHQQSPQVYYQVTPGHEQPAPPYAQAPARQPQQQQTRPQHRSNSHSAPIPARPPPTPRPSKQPQQAYQASSTPNRQPPAPQASVQRTVAHVQIPAHRPAVALPAVEMPREAKRRRSNEGNPIPVCQSPMPQKPRAQQRVKEAPVASSPLTELPSSQMPPTPPPNVDYQAVLLSLSDEYVNAAYDMSASLTSTDSSHEQLEEYHGLMSFAMGCLEAVLKHYRPDPRKEARMRLRLATLLHEETENGEQAEAVLSKGIAVCERSHLTDLKYTMHQLLVRVMSKTSPKAAMRAVDKLVVEVEALQLVHWMYVFRFLRVSLSLQVGSRTDTAAAIKNLTTISATAEGLRHVAVHVLAATMEAMAHLRSSAADAVELAQRALASARTHQLSEEMQRMPQIRALLDCLDVACALMQFSPDQIGAKMQQMHANMDTATKHAGWSKDGSFQVPLGVAAIDDLTAETGGVITSTSEGKAALSFRWLTKVQVYSLGYMLSGIATMHKDSGEPKAASYLGESLKMSKLTPDALVQSLAASTVRTEWQTFLGIAIRLQQAFAYCGRSEWTLALHTLRDLGSEIPDSDLASADKSNKAIRIYLEAVCKHGLGDLKAALALYSSPELAFESGSKDVGALRDVQAVAALDSILILRSVSPETEQQAEELHTIVEPYCLNHSNKALVAAYYLVKATHHTNSAAIIKRKQYLQLAVQAAQAVRNQQLLCVILNIMTDMFFHNIVGAQALKSAGAGRTLAVKTQNKLWTAVATNMYGNTLELTGDHEGSASAKHQGIQAMHSLSPTLRQKFREDAS